MQRKQTLHQGDLKRIRLSQTQPFLPKSKPNQGNGDHPISKAPPIEPLSHDKITQLERQIGNQQVCFQYVKQIKYTMKAQIVHLKYKLAVYENGLHAGGRLDSFISGVTANNRFHVCKQHRCLHAKKINIFYISVTRR